MKMFKWNGDKNRQLQMERGVSFEQIVFTIENSEAIDIIRHPNQSKCTKQRIYVLLIHDYVYLVPFVDSDDERFLKTIIPSRRFTKLLREGKR